MKVRPVYFVLPILFGSGLARAEGPSLFPGSKAPSLSIKRWLKGTPVAALPEHGVAVIEFWATWCGTCKPWYPRLSDLSHKHGEVTFIGVDIWEKDSEKLDQFVKDMAGNMDYNLAYSGYTDAMAKSWMDASKSNGIPTTFIVKDRVIQWIGHPMNLEQQLDDVLAGKNDVEKAKAIFLQPLADAEKNKTIANTVDQINERFWSGDRDGAKKKLAELKSDRPGLQAIEILEMSWLTVGKRGAYTAAMLKLLKQGTLEASTTATNSIFRSIGHKEARNTLHEAATAIMATGTDDGNFVFMAYQIFKVVKDQAGAKVSATKMLELYKQQGLEPKMKAQFEADAKGG